MSRNKFIYDYTYQTDFNNPNLSLEELLFSLWCVTFIGCYWYHNDNEKKIHI